MHILRKNSNVVKIVLSILIIITISILFSSCNKDDTQDKVEDLVQGNLDAVFLGKVDEGYTELVGTSEASIAAEHATIVKNEAIFFCYYIGSINEATEEAYNALPEKDRTKAEAMIDGIFQVTGLEVRDPEKEDDGSYSVEVLVKNVDVIKTAITTIENGECKPYESLIKKYNTGGFSLNDSEISDGDSAQAVLEENPQYDEYGNLIQPEESAETAEEGVPDVTDDELAFSSEYVNVFINLINELLPEAQQMEPQTLILKIQDNDNTFSISPEDLSKVNQAIIYYP